MKKTSISSVVCLDIIDFAKKTKAEQAATKKRFNALVESAVVDIPKKDRVIVDTGHGAVVTCSGVLESALEDALFIALTVRDEALNIHADNETPLYVLIGINLGSVRIAKSSNVNEEPKIVGEGLIEAQRIMSFANPNQILVSRAYYDMASKLTLEIAQMFEKYDMHAYEHDIYAVRRLGEKAAAELAATEAAETVIGTDQDVAGFNWQAYILPALLALIALFVVIKWLQGDAPETAQPDVSEQLIVEESITMPIESESVVKEDLTKEEVEMKDKPSEPVVAPKKSTKPPTRKTKAKTKSTQTKKAKIKTEEPMVAEPALSRNEKSGWDKFTDNISQGAEEVCTQGQKALNQCK